MNAQDESELTQMEGKKSGRRFSEIGLSLLLLYFILSDHGFCFSQLRFPGDRELIGVAIRSLAEGGQMKLRASDAEIANFMNEQPGCCSVERRPESRNFFDVLTGWNFSEVEINFAANARLAAGTGVKYYKQWMYVSSCGRVLKQGPGTGTKTLETAR